jgi:hypothetical protein
MREVYGNPWLGLSFDPSWRTPLVQAIAESAYEEQRFDDLPILADALEDAGAISPALLAHLREPGLHVRGCWALDLVLARE